MSEMDFENKLRSIANALDYPRTPDIAGRVTTRLGKPTRSRFHAKALVWSLTIILVLCSSLMLIPPARAAILEFIQIGVVRIFPQSVEPTDTAAPESFAPITATVSPPSSNLIPILDQIAGRTTLADAQSNMGFSILLPTYPAELGQPDHVYVQNADLKMVILVWLDPQHADEVSMSLHFIPNGSWVIKKSDPMVIEETSVDGEYAIWTTGPYPLIFRNGDIQFERLVNGHVLIWANADVTYRLETDLSMEEAIKIAESLEPIP